MKLSANQDVLNQLVSICHNNPEKVNDVKNGLFPFAKKDKLFFNNFGIQDSNVIEILKEISDDEEIENIAAMGIGNNIISALKNELYKIRNNEQSEDSSYYKVEYKSHSVKKEFKICGLVSLPFAKISPSEFYEIGITNKIIVNKIRLLSKAEDLENFNEISLDKKNLMKNLIYSKYRINNKFFNICSDDDLIKYIRGDIKELLLSLDEEQDKYVTKFTEKSPIVLKGEAGSGKTTIAIYRMKHFADRGNRVLYLSYNNSLVNATKTLFKRLAGDRYPIGESYESLEKVNIMTFDKYFKSAYSEITKTAFNTPFDNAEDKWLRETVDFFLRQNIILPKLDNNVPPTLPSSEDSIKKYLSPLRREFEEYIVGRAYGNLDVYLTIQRKGSGIGIKEEDRKKLFKIFQKFNEIKNSKTSYKKIYTFFEIPMLLDKFITTSKSIIAKFDHIVIDEIQDKTPLEIKCLKHFIKSDNGFFITGDPSQSIYKTSFTWRDFGLDVAGKNSIELDVTINYRNSKEVLTFAEKVAQNFEHIKFNKNTKAFSNGGMMPEKIKADTLDNQINWIVKDIEKKLNLHGVLPSNIGVLFCSTKGGYGNYGVKKFIEKTKDIFLVSKIQDDESLSHNTIKVSTFHSSKGLEFPVVYLVGVEDEYFSNISIPEEDRILNRKLLYVAITRAMVTLYVVGKNPPKFL